MRHVSVCIYIYIHIHVLQQALLSSKITHGFCCWKFEMHFIEKMVIRLKFHYLFQQNPIAIKLSLVLAKPLSEPMMITLAVTSYVWAARHGTEQLTSDRSNMHYTCTFMSWHVLFIHLHIEAETKWTPFHRRHFLPVKMSLKLVPYGPINNISALVQIMAWRRSGDKPLSEPMMIGLPTHTWVTRPQWVKE